jgi:hypothetical protein
MEELWKQARFQITAIPSREKKKTWEKPMD